MRTPVRVIPALTVLAATAFAQTSARDTPPTPTSSASRANQIVAFQPGIWIDWPTRSVRAAGRVVLRSGPIEFAACTPGKEHESLIVLEATATHLYQALGLAGFQPGHPPRWDADNGRYDGPEGSLVEVSVAWRVGSDRREADLFSWIEESEYARPARSVPWVFGGSTRLPDDTLAADRNGAILALVDTSDAMLSLTRRRSDRNADLWARARTHAIPAIGTPVTLEFRPPTRRRTSMRIDGRGDFNVDGRYESAAAVIDLIRIARLLDAGHTEVLQARGATSADVRRVRQSLSRLPEGAYRINRQ